MTQYSKEVINGAEMTVCWHGEARIDKVNMDRYWLDLEGYKVATAPRFISKEGQGLISNGIEHIATALPPLPRKPEPKDAALLYEYMAKGIYPCTDTDYPRTNALQVCKNGGSEIIYAADKDGNRLEIAITEGE